MASIEASQGPTVNGLGQITTFTSSGPTSLSPAGGTALGRAGEIAFLGRASDDDMEEEEEVDELESSQDEDDEAEIDQMRRRASEIASRIRATQTVSGAANSQTISTAVPGSQIESELVNMVLRLTKRKSQSFSQKIERQPVSQTQLMEQAQVIASLTAEREFLSQQAANDRALWLSEREGWDRMAEALIAQRNRGDAGGPYVEELERKLSIFDSDNKALRTKLQETQHRLGCLENELVKLKPLLLMHPPLPSSIHPASTHLSNIPYPVTSGATAAALQKARMGKKKNPAPLAPEKALAQENSVPPSESPSAGPSTASVPVINPYSKPSPHYRSDQNPYSYFLQQTANIPTAAPQPTIPSIPAPKRPARIVQKTKSSHTSGVTFSDARNEHILLAARKVGRERVGMLTALAASDRPSDESSQREKGETEREKTEAERDKERDVERQKWEKAERERALAASSHYRIPEPVATSSTSTSTSSANVAIAAAPSRMPPPYPYTTTGNLVHATRSKGKEKETERKLQDSPSSSSLVSALNLSFETPSSTFSLHTVADFTSHTPLESLLDAARRIENHGSHLESRLDKGDKGTSKKESTRTRSRRSGALESQVESSATEPSPPKKRRISKSTMKAVEREIELPPRPAPPPLPKLLQSPVRPKVLEQEARVRSALDVLADEAAAHSGAEIKDKERERERERERAMRVREKEAQNAPLPMEEDPPEDDYPISLAGRPPSPDADAEGDIDPDLSPLPDIPVRSTSRSQRSSVEQM
ncbi:hypothetical protein C8J56DRAFT_354559 [Mycena floridula]|nr:hypothetical protein C8J56DRAFT_354559 [Mycena floridula]